ncbi:hypothetical protein BDV12DRAFT_165847 [Aspergillus spectabilis]
MSIVDGVKACRSTFVLFLGLLYECMELMCIFSTFLQCLTVSSLALLVENQWP